MERVLAVAVVAVALAGCGGGGSSLNGGKTITTSAPRPVKKGNPTAMSALFALSAFCHGGSRVMHEFGEGATPDLKQSLPLTERVVSELRALVPPPELKATYDDLVAGFEELVAGEKAADPELIRAVGRKLRATAQQFDDRCNAAMDRARREASK
jgi:hypothetical protein